MTEAPVRRSITVYETALPDTIPDDLRYIRITREPKYLYGPTPDLAEVDRWLARVPTPERLEYFGISRESALNAVPDIRRFVNLRTAHIEGMYVERYEPLYEFTELNDLFLVSYKRRDLSDFRRLNLQHFRAIRGRVVHLELDARNVLLQNCTKLETFGDSDIQSLTLDACNRVDLDTMPRLNGLRSLSIEGRPSLASLDFIDRCPLLEALALSGMR